jgi:hypothetical protein
MKRGVLIALLLLFTAFPLVSLAQDQEDPAESPYGLWKRNFASPTYGVTVFNARVEWKGLDATQSSFNRGEFIVPAIDFRIFKAVNVSRRGGFYTGVEVGTLILLPITSKRFNDVITVDDISAPYTYGPNAINFDVEVYGGAVFIMMKYGLRYDFGSSLRGFSLGFELGSGAALQVVGYRIVVSDNVDEDSGSDEVAFNFVVEPSAEFGIRMGRNFRFLVKGGVIIMPALMRRDRMYDNNVLNDGATVNGDEEYLRYALQGYDVELGSVGFDLRVGFALNFN